MTTAACDDLAIYRPPVARENEERKWGYKERRREKTGKIKIKSQPLHFELLLKFMYRRLTLGHF